MKGTRLLVFLALLGALGLVQPAYAATITVTTTADEFGAGAGCSLREAIQAANTDAAFGGCTAGSGDDTITLPAGTYTLTRAGSAEDLNQTGDLDIRSNITINGAGAASTIVDGNNSDRVIDVRGGVALAVSRLTIQNGNVNGSGGGINNENNIATVTVADSTIRANMAVDTGGGVFNKNGTVTITNSTVSDNKGRFVGGILNDGGTLSVTGSTLSGNRADETAGGIHNRGSGSSTTISDSTLSGNRSRFGGGILNEGTLAVSTSTFSNNEVNEEGGGIRNQGSGSAATIVTSTFNGNKARFGGGIFNEGTLAVTNSTFSNNEVNEEGGGVRSTGTLSVLNSTFSGNGARFGGGIFRGGGQANIRATVFDTGSLGANCSGPLTSQGSNVADDGTCFTGGLNGDQVVADVGLGPLANNGGPTQTHLPRVDSPAVRAVISGCPPPATDQRGVSRPSGGLCDAGSVELAADVLQLSSTTYSVQENGGTATITVTRTGSTTGAVSATVTLSGGTATPGADYIGTSFDVSFAAGETSKTISVPIVDDALDGNDETVNVTLSSPTSGATLGTPAAAVLTIVDDDAPPTVSITGTARVPEGNARAASAVLTATLSAPSGRTVTVQAQTVDGTATAGLDYVAVPLTTLTFRPGETVNTVPVQVLGDLLNEPDETFLGVLSNPTNATIGVGQVVVTIADDDDPPALSINDVTVIEGNVGTTNAQFTVHLSAASARPVTVSVQTANGTATAGSDYTAVGPLTLTFSPGETEKTVTVPILGDIADEPDETFTVNLSTPSNAFIADREGVGTIVDDDGPPTLHISGVTVVEGDAGTVDAVFTVQLLPVSGQDVSVVAQTADGTATAGSDYTAVPPTTLRFPPGTAAQTVTVNVIGDVTDEADETFFVRLSSPQNASIATSEAVGTIQDDDDPEVEIDDVAVVEGDSGSVNAEFTVSLKGPSEQTVVVEAVVVDGTATAGSDYTSPGLIRLTFPPGTTSQPLIVAVTGDLLDEPDETFLVNLTAVSTLRGGLRPALHKAQGVGTIIDDDTATLAVDDVTVDEGDSGSVDAVFTVLLTRPSSETVTVVAQTADGTATAGLDYTSVGPVTLTFPAGTTSETFTVPVLGDLLDEPNETFVVNLTAPSLGRIARAQGLGTIRDDDTASLSVNDVTVVGEDSGSEDAVFTVSLSTPSTQTVTVVVRTADGTATAGSDYTAVGPITLTFAPGVTSQTVSVPILGDTIDEPDETFTVNLSSPTNATLKRNVGVGTILDNDGPPSLTIGDVIVVEGDTGSAAAEFAVTLLPASGVTVTVVAQTANGTASAGSDYTAVGPLTLTFAPGTTLQTVTVPIVGDTAVEPDETFTVTLSGAVGATVGDNQGVGTILNDDELPTLGIGDATVLEGDKGTANAEFTVSLSARSDQTVTVVAQTADGTATAGSDYTAVGPITLTFPPGVTSQTFSVPIIGDIADEPNETFTVNLSAPSNAAVGTGQGTGTILDDDAALPDLGIGDVRIVEGDVGTVNAVFTVGLSTASTQTVTVSVQTADGTATAGNDYTAVPPTTLTFPAGTTSRAVVVPVIGDTTREPDETFTLNLSAATNAGIVKAQGVGTILDDDTPVVPGGTPSLSIDDVSVVEGNGGTTPAVFTVRLSAATSATVTVTVQTADGTATAGSDYTPVGPITLTFPTGTTTQTVTVPILGDTNVEPDETFTVNLSAPGNATIGDGQGLGTIRNDDGGSGPGPAPQPTPTPGPSPQPTPTPTPPAPSPGDDDTDKHEANKPRVETEDGQRQRQRTNRGGEADVHTEGNVVEVHQDEDLPFVVIANIDGLVKVMLYCKDQCPRVQVGQYLEADGEKINEQLFEATDVSVKGPGH